MTREPSDFERGFKWCDIKPTHPQVSENANAGDSVSKNSPDGEGDHRSAAEQ